MSQTTNDLSKKHLKTSVKPHVELPAVWRLTNVSRISGDHPPRDEIVHQELGILRREVPAAKGPQSLASSCSLPLRGGPVSSHILQKPQYMFRTTC